MPTLLFMSHSPIYKHIDTATFSIPKCFLSNIYTPMNAVGATQGSVSCSTILKYTEAGRDRTTNLPVSR